MIVFDVSTLILLAKTELLDLFLNNYKGEVMISKEVEKECYKKKSFDALLIKKRVQEEKIIVKKALKKEVCEKLMQDFNTSKGEAEAIALALQENAKLVGTDDKNAVNACKLLNIPFTSAIDILIRMKEKKLVDNEVAGLRLYELAKYGRYSERIIVDAKKRLKVK